MTSDLAGAILDGDRRALARGITLVESTHPDHRAQADALLQAVLPAAGGATRLGVTGSPGVGKSTFIDAFGGLVVDGGASLAVLAVDPSSSTGGGSILGDKTRMANLVGRPDVFIRPSPSGGGLGGIARRTRDAVTLCEAAGYDMIVVETVGVGQSETAVATVTDLFLLLVGPGGGDDLQGIKRGVMELADLVVINKADGDLVGLAERTASDYRGALHLVRAKHEGRQSAVLTCSSLSGDGLAAVAEELSDLHRWLADEGRLRKLRSGQAVAQLADDVGAALLERADANPAFAKAKAELERGVADGTLPVSTASRRLVEVLWPAS